MSTMWWAPTAAVSSATVRTSASVRSQASGRCSAPKVVPPETPSSRSASSSARIFSEVITAIDSVQGRRRLTSRWTPASTNQMMNVMPRWEREK
ncbi:MAG: hypothetical protein GEV00_23520 [Actinophytocola sp.]|nr:hypothetical protein [Actinophytocola sp.]